MSEERDLREIRKEALARVTSFYGLRKHYESQDQLSNYSKEVLMLLLEEADGALYNLMTEYFVAAEDEIARLSEYAEKADEEIARLNAVHEKDIAAMDGMIKMAEKIIGNVDQGQ